MPRQSLVLVLLSLVVSARVLNITVDDDTPATSRAAVSYDPAGAWFEGQNCLGTQFSCPLVAMQWTHVFASRACHAKPDVNTAYNGTWHHTTDDGGINTQDTVLTIQFTGENWQPRSHISLDHRPLRRDGNLCFLYPCKLCFCEYRDNGELRL